MDLDLCVVCQMSGVDYADVFNKKLGEFFEDLEQIGINNVQDYPLMKASCQFLASVDKRRPAEMFHKYVVGPYQAQITDRDEEFFWNESYNSVSDMAIVNAIKHIWKTLDDTNKNAVWMHMQVLMVLARKVVSNA